MTNQEIAALAILKDLAEKGKLTDAERRQMDNLAAKAQSEHVRAGWTPGNSPREITAEDRAFTKYLRSGIPGTEMRAMGEAMGSQGGYLVPESFYDRLAQALKLYGGLSQYALQFPTDDGRIAPFPTNDSTGILGSYVTENAQVEDQTDYVFGQGRLFAFTITSGVVKASVQVITDSEFDVDSFVANKIGEAIGRKVAAEVVSGAGPGSEAMTGIIPSLSAYGATTDNDSGGYYALGTATVAKMMGNDSATETGANVLSAASCAAMQASIDPAYWPSMAWYMNATQALNMRQLVDDQNRPLINLDHAFADGVIGTIFGVPVRICQEIPNLTANTVGGPLLAALDHAYVVRTVKSVEIMRLTERYADFLQVGFLGYVRMDGQPVDLRSAVVPKPASS